MYGSGKPFTAPAGVLRRQRTLQRRGAPSQSTATPESSSSGLSKVRSAQTLLPLTMDAGQAIDKSNSLSMASSCPLLLQTSMADSFDEDLETGDLEDILVKMKNSVESDPRQAAVWNILGLVLLQGGQLQNAILMFHILKGQGANPVEGLVYITKKL